MAGGSAGFSRPLVSVVVPVYNVAGYLAECLESIRGQDVPGLEIIAVDDGSTDDSPEILARLAPSEPRMRVVTQANQGLGAARNVGVAEARGEYLWFVDSDDLLAPGAIRVMLDALTSTGSDLATGNVLRLSGQDTRPARFLAETFARTRMRTHIRRFPPLVADRVAWNKLYRRSFWERHGFEFPVGVHYEDQYVTLPAHYLARSVDVLRDPVYLWRVRDDEQDASITQRRTDLASMLDRVKAVVYVSTFLAGLGRPKDKQRYDESAVTHDLRYFLELFDRADPQWQTAFLAAIEPYLAGVDPSALARLPAIRRLEWERAQRGDRDGLAELVRFEREDLGAARATRVGRRWYVKFPRLAEGSSASPPVRVRRELHLMSRIDELAVHADAVRVRGRAAIDLVGPVGDGLHLLAVPQGAGLPLWFRTEVGADGTFVADLSLSAVTRLTRGRRGSWRLVLLGHDHGLQRVAVWHHADPAPSAARRVFRRERDAMPWEVCLELVGRGRLDLTVGRRPVTLRAQRIDASGVLDLIGDLGDVATSATALVAQDPQGAVVTQPLHVDPAVGGSRFAGRLPLEALLGHGSASWSLGVRTDGRINLLAPAREGGAVDGGVAAGVLVALASDDRGYLVLRVTPPPG